MPLFESSAARGRALRSASASWITGRKKASKLSTSDSATSLGYEKDWQAVGKELDVLLSTMSFIGQDAQSQTSPPSSSKRKGGGWDGKDKKRRSEGAEPSRADVIAYLFAIAKDLLTKFLALPPRTQVTLSWGVLILSIFCISGLWKLKFIFTMFLLLFKPVVSNLAPSEANSNNKSKSKKQRDASGAHFSDDPLIAALQRIPETFIYGNVAPGQEEMRGELASSPPVVPAPCLQDESDKEPAGPCAEGFDHTGTIPSESSLPTSPPNGSSMVDEHRAPRDAPGPRTAAGLGRNGWQHGPSGSFHRIEVVKKAWRRTFSSSAEAIPPESDPQASQSSTDVLLEDAAAFTLERNYSDV